MIAYKDFCNGLQNKDLGSSLLADLTVSSLCSEFVLNDQGVFDIVDSVGFFNTITEKNTYFVTEPGPTFQILLYFYYCVRRFHFSLYTCANHTMVQYIFFLNITI